MTKGNKTDLTKWIKADLFKITELQTKTELTTKNEQEFKALIKKHCTSEN